MDSRRKLELVGSLTRRRSENDTARDLFWLQECNIYVYIYIYESHVKGSCS